MSYAFLIIAHSDPQHLARLVARLSDYDVYVHWDRKSGPHPKISGVTFITEPVFVFWAGYSQISATLKLLEAAIDSGKTYDKIVLLSGSCYPIRPLSELCALFEKDGNHLYINSISVDDSPHLTKMIKNWSYRDGILPNWIHRFRKIVFVERVARKILNFLLKDLPKRRPDGVNLFHGSQWWAISSEAGIYVVNALRRRSALTKFYKRTFASDEQIVQTLLRNSVFAEKCAPTMQYTGRGTYKTANLHLIDPSLSKWFDERDIGTIAASEFYFVRKVSSSKSSKLLDWIDENKLQLRV